MSSGSGTDSAWRRVLGLDTPPYGFTRFRHFWTTWVVYLVWPVIILVTLLGVLLLLDGMFTGFQITGGLLMVWFNNSH